MRLRRRRGHHAKVSLTALLFQQSFLLTVSSGISGAGGFLAWSIAAHASTPHTVGVAAGLFASCSLLSYLTSLALPYGLLRYGRSSAAGRMLYLALLVTAVTSIAGAAVFALGSRWWAPALSSQLINPVELIIYAAFNVVIAVSVLFDAYFVSRGRAGLTCGRNTIASIGKVAGVIVLAVIGDEHAGTIFAAMVIPVAISIIFVSPLLLARSRSAFDEEIEDATKAFFQYSLKTYPGALLDGAPIFLLPVLALRLIGPTSNAYFYIAWSIASVVGLLSSAVGQITLREAASHDDQRALARRAKTLSLVVTGLAVLVLGIEARLTIEIFGLQYMKAIIPLRILLLSMLPGAHLTITIAVLRGRKLHGAVNQASIAYAVLSIGAAVGLGAVDGITGLCLGWLIGVSLSAILAALIAERQSPRISRMRGTRVVASTKSGDRCAA
jgi:O-antigen/teichoic acid export membrane protein